MTAQETPSIAKEVSAIYSSFWVSAWIDSVAVVVVAQTEDHTPDCCSFSFLIFLFLEFVEFSIVNRINFVLNLFWNWDRLSSCSNFWRYDAVVAPGFKAGQPKFEGPRSPSRAEWPFGPRRLEQVAGMLEAVSRFSGFRLPDFQSSAELPTEPYSITKICLKTYFTFLGAIVESFFAYLWVLIFHFLIQILFTVEFLPDFY